MINCDVNLLDVDERGRHGSDYFALTDNFVSNELNNNSSYLNIKKVFNNVLLGIYKDRGFIGDMPAYLDVEILDNKIVLPDKVDNLDDLHDVLFKVADEACCYGLQDL